MENEAGPPPVADPCNGEHEPQPDLWPHHQWGDEHRKDCPFNVEGDNVD